MKKNGSHKIVEGTSPSGWPYSLTIPMEGSAPKGGTHPYGKADIKVSTLPQVREGRAQRRAKRRLKGRIQGWEDAQKSARHNQRKPGAMDRVR